MRIDRPYRFGLPPAAIGGRSLAEETELDLRIAVLIPCHNEQAAIAQVVADFAAALPRARLIMCDNNSTDDTVARARAAGAEIRHERMQGKGHVVRRMFADIEADIFIIVDGDGTYRAADAPLMVRLLCSEHLDMVTATRRSADDAAWRAGHRWGNRAISFMVRQLFGNRIDDLLSGYRVFSRRFVKSFPALAAGFEIETEFSVHALELDMPIGQIESRYGARQPGSASKLRTYADGWRIGMTILTLLRDQRPLLFFGLAGCLLLLAGFGLGLPVIGEYLHTGLVPRLPTAVLATGLILIACLSFTCGLVLDSVARGRKEAKRLAYLSVPAAGER